MRQHLANLFLSVYKNINRTGILNYDWAQSAFVSGYFAYKKYLEDAYAKLITRYPALFHHGHILDIGANIGYTAYVFSKALTPSYKVFAFEPEERNVRILKKIATNYDLNNLILTAAAVGDREGEVEIWQNDGHHADHRVLTPEFRRQLKNTTLHIQKTPLVTIDQFLKRQQATQPIVFIKIDVQGYELAVCRGMEETLSLNPDCVVGFEYCPSIMQALGYEADDLIRFFQDKQYIFYRLNKNGSLEQLNLKTNPFIISGKNFSGYFDILCSRKLLTN